MATGADESLHNIRFPYPEGFHLFLKGILLFLRNHDTASTNRNVRRWTTATMAQYIMKDAGPPHLIDEARG
jgi:hypothetical protein